MSENHEHSIAAGPTCARGCKALLAFHAQAASVFHSDTWHARRVLCCPSCGSRETFEERRYAGGWYRVAVHARRRDRLAACLPKLIDELIYTHPDDVRPSLIRALLSRGLIEHRRGTSVIGRDVAGDPVRVEDDYWTLTSAGRAVCS